MRVRWRGLIGRTVARIASLFRRDDLDRDFEAEAQSHIDLATDDYILRGMSPPDAERQARIKFGSMAASKDAHRDSRGLPWLDSLLFDARLAFKGLQRDRGFTLTAIAMLTLGIGLNATVFAVTDAILYRGYPLVQRNDQIVFLQERAPGRCCMSYADFLDWRAEARSFVDMAYLGGRAITFRANAARPLDMRITTVSPNAFAMLGVAPLLGRDFVTEDESPGAPPVVMLNHRFWVSHFDRREDIVGSIVYVDGVATTVIGVMPGGFELPIPIEGQMWMPMLRTPEAQQQRGLNGGGFTTVARLNGGISIDEARTELESINRRLAASYPETNRELMPFLATPSQFNSGPDASMIWGSLWVASVFVLIIACANLMNLSLVRTIGRWREFATKLALGAGQSRMIRQIAIESGAIAAVAAALSWWITKWTVGYWAAITVSQYQVIDYTVDGRTLVYLMTIATAAALVLAIAPIVRVAQIGAGGALKGDARGVTQGLRGKQLSSALVAGQMALVVILLAGAGVLVRSFLNIVGADTGIHNPERVVVGIVRLPSALYPTPEDRRRYFERLQLQLRALPEVEAVSLASTKPVVRGAVTRTFEIEGRAVEATDSVQFVASGADYFSVLGVKPRDGRQFDDRDGTQGPPVAVVNEGFAARYWPNQDPIGRRIRTTDRNRLGEWRVVVGVVPNIKQGDALRQEFKPIVYVPFAQEPPFRAAYFLVRGHLPADQLTSTVRGQIEVVDQGVGIEDFSTLENSLGFDRDFMPSEHSELGKHAKIAPVFAVIALILSAIGLVAVIAHSVSQRTKEIGVRVAIGAAMSDISRMITREGMAPVAIGLAAGVAASLAVNRILQSQLVGVSPYDPMTMIGAPVTLIAVALLACRVPARRAMRVDPVIALRHE